MATIERRQQRDGAPRPLARCRGPAAQPHFAREADARRYKAQLEGDLAAST